MIKAINTGLNGQLEYGTKSDFSVRIWGARGSIPCADKDFLTFGGNTSCVEVVCGKHSLVFDAGSGIHTLGKQLSKNNPDGLITNVFLSHTHHDHILGVPFFKPNFCRASTIHYWAGHLKNQDENLHDILCRFMQQPLFPISPDIFVADVEFHDFVAGEDIEPFPDFKIRTAPLAHPNGATTYRVDYEGRSFCYVTDTEHKIGEPDQNILKLIKGADCVIYDCSFNDENFGNFIGWGHSTWQEGLRLCKAAGAKQLIPFHHSPSSDDNFLKEEEERAQAIAPSTIFARESMTIYL